MAADGVAVDVKIYKLEGDPQWALEAINEQRTSAVWGILIDNGEEA
jgi:hypothetical protein